jgi:tetratricopeptide (TPR) repeat protein
MRQGRASDATELTGEAVAIARRTGDPILLANTLQNHSWALVQAGADFGAPHQELVRLQREAGNRAGLATALQMSGLAALDAGDIAAARVDLQESGCLADEVGSSQLKLYALVNLGLVAFLDGDHQPARASFTDALALARDSDKSTIPYALLGLALTAPDTDPEQAAELHGAVDRLLEQAGESLERLEARLRQQDHQRLTALLGDERFHNAHAAGRARPLDEIISGAIQI